MALTRPRYSQIYDTDYKQSVRLATTADVGNLLAGGGNITNTVDGSTVAANDRILVKNQADTKQNGIYRVVTVGTGSNGTWIRTLDADASDKVTSGLTTTISEGSTNAGKTFKLTTPDPIVLGTSGLIFVDPFAAAGAAGANTYVQFNDSSSLNGTAGFRFNKFTNAVSISGNVSARSFIGNLITDNSGIVDGEIFAGNAILNIASGTSNIRIYSSSNIAVSSNGIANVVVIGANSTTITGNLLPSANLIYDFGSPTQRWATGYFGGNTLDLGGSQISVNPVTGTFTFTGNGISTDLGGTSTFNPIGNVSIGGNLFVSGAVYIAGNTSTISTNNVVFNDALIYLANGNPTDFLDIGSVGNFTRSSLFQHTGFVRDATDGVWKLFEGVEPVPTTTVDFGSASYSTALIGNLVTRSNITLGGNLRLGGALLNSAGIGGSPGQLLQSTGTGITWVTADFSTNTIFDGDTSVTTSDPYVIINTNGISTANIGYDNSYLYSRNFILSGNVGIGNIAPLHPLSVNGDIFTNGQLGINTDPGYNLHVYGSGTQNSIVVEHTSTNYLRMTATNTAAVFDWFDNVPLVFNRGLNERMRIAPTGNVGIGNAAPLHSLSVNGDIFVGNITTSSNAVANIGSVSNRFNTVHARATQAQYADLAEIYTSDKKYIPGTVLVFGGTSEVTVSLTSHDPSVAGVVSTNPAYLMNDSVEGVAVALQGRVPCRVLGPVVKGDRVVTSDVRGVAERLDMSKYQPGCIIGKALSSVPDGEITTIEVVVGRN